MQVILTDDGFLIGCWRFIREGSVWIFVGPNYFKTHDAMAEAKKPVKDYDDENLSPEQVQNVREILSGLGR